MAEILVEIIDAEKKAKDVREYAAKQAQNTISEAKIEANKIIESKKKELEKAKSAEIEKISKEMAELRKSLLDENEKEIAKLQKNAQKNVDQAADFLVKKFTEAMS